jgi:hypothetical protein
MSASVVYTFDYLTGAYTGELQLTVGDIDPRTNCWMIPGNATTAPPPRCGEKLMPVWCNGQWEVYELIAEIPDELLNRVRYGVEEMYKQAARNKT